MAEDESDELFAPSGLPMCASLWGDADADADGGGASSPSSALPRSLAASAATAAANERRAFNANGGGGGAKDDDAPKHLLCPITCELMLHPVVAPDGHTYERTAIERWLAKKRTSPMTAAPMGSGGLVPNHALKSMISEFRASKGG